MRVLVTALLLTACAAAAIPGPAAAVELPPQGVYEQCAPRSRACDDRLRSIAANGFRLVLNYSLWNGRPADLRRYAGRASAVGVELVLPLNHRAWRLRSPLAAAYPALLGRCRPQPCPGARASRARALSIGSRLPAVWGWYVGDELPPAEAPRVADLSAAIRRADPRRPRLYVGFRNPYRRDDARLLPFAPSAEVLGYAAYPIGYDVGLDVVGSAAGEARDIAAGAGRVPAAVLQAFDWRRYGVTQLPQPPTAAEMRLMRDQAVLGGARLLLWYSWQDLLRAPDVAARLAELRDAAFAPAPPGGA